ncbi:MAG: AmmeMemoRadiSam system radical SAM enzyme [Candidatus Ranarchaeia archaeon]|jgi:pyruvate formate lyase activating enzyme
MEEARYYTKTAGKKVECFLCRHNCLIAEGKLGLCRVRKNDDGVLYSLVYGELVATNVDPIEKKPLYHVLPGSKSYSIATIGCNFTCLNCQNADISQVSITQSMTRRRVTPPQKVVEDAILHECQSIAYTYTEPTIFFEYAFDVAKIASSKGLYNIFVTNGYIGEEPLRDIAPYLNAANIDLKSSREEFYTKICGGKLDRLLESIRLYKKLGIFLEITTLVIPEYNDSDEDLRGVAQFISSLDDNIPWHLSRFHPHYKLKDHRSTPVETLLKAYKIAEEEGINFVYLGNVPGTNEDTLCPTCERQLIVRYGYAVSSNKLQKQNTCPNCKSLIPGIFQ